MKLLKMFVGMGVVLFIAVGCAPESRKPVDLVWPLPPEKPRIKYIEMIFSNKDIEKKGGVADVLLGERDVVPLAKPYGVFGRGGKFYVTDLGKVFVFDPNNQKVTYIGNRPGIDKLKVPIGVAVSADGRIFVSDAVLNKVFVFESSGKFITALGRAGEFENPAGIAIDDERKKLYIVDTKKHNIIVYSLDYRPVATIGKRGREAGELNFPTNVAIDGDGNILVTDTGNFRIQKLGPDGEFIMEFGSVGDKPGNFGRPKGIALDSEGHIYVVDASFQNVQIFSKDGDVLMFFGQGGPGPGQFFVPAGIAIDENDRIYIADQLNKRVQIFQYLGEGRDDVKEDEVKVKDEAEKE